MTEMPQDVPQSIIDLIEKCWNGESHLRPDMMSAKATLEMLQIQEACSTLSTSQQEQQQPGQSSGQQSEKSEQPLEQPE